VKNKKIKAQFNWLKHSKVYFAFSLMFIGVGLFSVLKWGLPLGLDFMGGANISYKVSESSQVDVLKERLSEKGIEPRVVVSSGEDRVVVKTLSLDEEKQKLTLDIANELGIERVELQNVGPAIGPELVKKTITAILIAGAAILLWVATQFKKLSFGISAILATLHDSVVLIGMFAILGHFWGAEIDFLFVTALLTTLSFSVHDTIVVFDRIREIQKKHGGELGEVANRAISETMRRSIINSLTIIMMLVALVVLGGDTIRWFATALLIGAISGTYSSPFVAVPLFVALEKLQRRFKKK